MAIPSAQVGAAERRVWSDRALAGLSEGKRELELAECALVFFGPRLRRGLQRFQELTLLVVAELEILAGRGEPAAVSLGLDPLREAAGRLRGLWSVLELGYQRSRCVLGHAQPSIGEEEADGWHRPRA
jgi:hypothetical protein